MPILAYRVPRLYTAAIRRLAPEVDIHDGPAHTAPADTSLVLVLKEIPEGLHRLKKVQVVQSVAAGVDHLIESVHLPREVAISRVTTEGQAESIGEYVALHVLRQHKQLEQLIEEHRRARWMWRVGKRASDVTVGILGMGHLGQSAVSRLLALGFRVRGWSRTPKVMAGFESFAGEAALPAFLSGCNHLVCLLPLTAETTGILNRELFEQLPRGAWLINAGRGDHLVEEDLIAALDSRQLAGATLDVMRVEPVPADHPFWQREDILITPHTAAAIEPREVAPLVVQNYRRILAGLPPHNVVDRHTGY